MRLLIYLFFVVLYTFELINVSSAKPDEDEQPEDPQYRFAFGFLGKLARSAIESISLNNMKLVIVLVAVTILAVVRADVAYEYGVLLEDSPEYRSKWGTALKLAKAGLGALGVADTARDIYNQFKDGR